MHLASDGTEETALVVYDNSAFKADVTKGKVLQMWIAGSYTGSLVLEWDQTANSPIMVFGKGDGGHYDFRNFGGIQNPGATGATGDVVLTTRALANLDDLQIILDIDQS
jgi:hypothetical protein